MDTCYNVEENNSFEAKVINYETKLKSGISLDDVVDDLEEEHVYRLIDKLSGDGDNLLESVIFEEDDTMDLEYKAIIEACVHQNIDFNTNQVLVKEREKIKKIG